MEGRIISISNSGKGSVNTGNNQYGILPIYQLPPNVAVDMTIEFTIRVSAIGNTYAVFSSIVERNTALFNTEDRSRWYTWGEDEEGDFVRLVVPDLHIDLRKNPEKETRPWAIDLIDYTHNRFADLKTQNTPFFSCGQYQYNGEPYDPRYTVTFNKKDYENYIDNHPDCDIYFWVNWRQLSYRQTTIEGLYGVWRAPFSVMAEKIESGQVVLHAYLHRTDDDHNAKDSYLFMLNDPNVFERLL